MKVMTIADSLIEEGIEQGIEQFRSLLIKQLRSHFPNHVTSAHLYRIEKAEGDQLFYWIERLATASSIKEVFSCL